MTAKLLPPVRLRGLRGIRGCRRGESCGGSLAPGRWADRGVSWGRAGVSVACWGLSLLAGEGGAAAGSSGGGTLQRVEARLDLRRGKDSWVWVWIWFWVWVWEERVLGIVSVGGGWF